MSVNANNVFITGGNFSHNNSYVVSPVIQKFPEYFSKDALYSSQERSEECNPQTVNNTAREWTARLRHMSIPSSSTSDSRNLLFDALELEYVIKDIFIWLHDPYNHCLAMWVYDDDRSRTSLIGQAVAEILAERKELAATYFFPSKQQKGLSNAGNGTAYPSFVVPTIAYQLVQEIPDVARTLTRDDSIFKLKVHKQIAELVINPLKQASELLEQVPLKAIANVIIVHGLEDCGNADFEAMFLDEIISGLATIEPTIFSQRLLVLGRSTDRLRECFSKWPGRILQRPLHIQRWQTREHDIERREEKIRKDEEDLVKKLEIFGRDAEAVQKAWKIRSQAKQIEEEIRQREGRLLLQEQKLWKQREELLQQAVKLDELHAREKWVMQQIEALKRREDKVNEREEQVDRRLERERSILDIKKEEFGQFRIVVIGDSGVGKTSLVKSISRIDPKVTRDAHEDATSSANECTSSDDILRFILHEVGILGKKTMRGDNSVYVWMIVDHFFRTRSKRNMQERIHGIWFCIDLTPGFFFRPKSVIDKQKLFSLAKELNIPVFTVFTKYDLLVNQKRRDRGDPSESDLEQHAENWFCEYIKRHNLVRPESASFVKVSTSETYPRRLERLRELAEVTRKYLEKHYGFDAK